MASLNKNKRGNVSQSDDFFIFHDKEDNMAFELLENYF